MITVISPAKSLDFDTPAATQLSSTPVFWEQAGKLILKLRIFSPKKVMQLMDISADLAALNVERYLQFEIGADAAKTKQALLAFDGDVYQGMEAREFTASDLEFAQDHLRILSGLYGILRPMDRIQPYRLEMGTRLKVGRAKDLYAFWGTQVTAQLNAAIAESGSEVLLNLASQEYFGAVQVASLKAQLITPVFLDRKGDDYKIVSFWAKKARGKMAAWIIANRLNEVKVVQDFEAWGYRYNAALSTADRWAFTRETPQ